MDASTKSITTLIPDIYKLLETKDGWFTEVLATDLSVDIAARLRGQLSQGVADQGSDTSTTKGSLRLSKMGTGCPCALWYSVNHPHLQETLPSWATIKFSFGHILEAYITALAKAAGHEVTGEQDEVIVDGIRGHRDCVIDGCIVDVKSASTYMFNRIRQGQGLAEDPFINSYLAQLDGYLVGSANDDLVRCKDRGYILAVDKTLGHLCLYEHRLREQFIRERISEAKRIVSLRNPPQCSCGTVPDGKSGNIRLDTKASYNSYKYCCRPSLRTFLYSDGPRYLTKVVRKPDVPEIDRLGRIVYNVQ